MVLLSNRPPGSYRRGRRTAGQEREGKGKRRKGRGKSRAWWWEEPTPTQYKQHNNTEDGPPFLSVPQALFLKEKGPRGVGGLSVGKR